MFSPTRLVLLLTASLLLPSFAVAEEVDWTATFNDQPLNPNHVKNIEKALPTEPIVTPLKPRRVLVFSATSGFRHGSIPVGLFALESMGQSTGAYETVVSNDPANFEAEALKQFDTVILLNSTGDIFMPSNTKQLPLRDKFTDAQWNWLKQRNDRLIDNLIDYVEAGGGLVGIHAASDACYGHHEFGQAIGGQFWGHPWTANMNVTIVVEDPEHAINKPVFDGIDDFRIKEEIYQFSEKHYSRDRLRILLHLDPERSDEPKWPPKRKDGDFAVAWVQKVGEGRVFYTSLGHRHDIYWNPLLLKHYLAGIQFATGDLPADTTPSNKVELPNLSRGHDHHHDHKH
ncbi:MAG: ThuA domain-containing protein [Planctomycetota bacterium]